MIELRNISRTYKPKKGEEVRALNKINLTFGSTGMVFVLGKSGSGKSTLLNVIGGLDKYDEGDLLIQGKSTSDFKQSDFDSYRNTMIGFIFQEYNVLDNFTVAQNIGLALELQGKKATNEAINNILDSVDLNGYARRKPNELSGGQKQRVAIARALVKDPKVIMADEPTGALDSNTGRQVLETLEKLAETRLVIVVSHDREFAETYGTRIIEFKDGSIISDVSRQKTTKNDDIKPLSFTASNIKIKQGYELTNTDLKVINDYLKRTSRDASIEKIFNQATFAETKDTEINVSKDNYHSIKSKLPFKISLKIGASSLKNKTVRLVMSIILASVAFAMFGLADTMGSYNKYDTTSQSMIDSNIEYAAMEKVENIEHEGWVEERSVRMDDTDIAALNTKFPAYSFLPIYRNNNFNLSVNNNLFDSITGSEMSYYHSAFSGILEFDSTNINEFNIDFLGTSSRLPNTFDEIAITKHMYELFQKYGFREEGNTTKIAINNYDNLLNRELLINNKKYKIVGILDSKFNSTRFESLKEFDGQLSQFLLSQEYQTVLSFSHHYSMYVKKGFIDDLPKAKGIYINDTNWWINVYDNATQYYYWGEYIDLIGNYEQEDFTFLKNVGYQTLQQNDIIIQRDLFFNNNYSIVQDLGDYNQNYMMTYVNSLSDQVLLDALEDNNVFVDPVIENWTEGDRSQYRIEYYGIYYFNQINVENSFGKDYDTLLGESEVLFFNNLDPITLVLESTDYFSNTQNKEDIRVVGFYENDLISNSTYLMTNNLYNSFNFTQQGNYSSAISTISLDDRESLDKLIIENYKDELGVNYVLRNEVIATLNQVNTLIEGLSNIFLYVGIGFAVFSSLLLLNYITISVSYKKKEIGILRAIGARGRDVVGIFFKEAMIIALINFFVATGIAIFTIITINSQLRNEYGLLLTILNFGIRQVILMLAVSIVVAFISSSIPVSRIARKRPIDAIRDK